MSVEHLYVHVPFCARKCPYCDFNSHAGRDAEVEGYLDALAAEARAKARGLRPRTVFVGGGTPTQPSASQLDRYLDAVLGAVDTSALEEVTVEANPGTLTEEKVRVLVRHGVHRVSLGVQSFDDDRLRVLGRVHDARDAAAGVALLREGGVRRVSLDLMLATPGQTLDEQRRDLDRAVALRPDHVSTYVLTFEEGTAFARLLREGRFDAPQEGRDLEHLHAACDHLAAAGYRRYEVSNHARAGEECLHNLGYWRDADWLGLGAGAHSHVEGARRKNVDDPAAYAARVSAGGDATEWEERPAPRTALFDALMMGLRLVDEGVDLELLAARHGVDPRVEHAAAIERHVTGGFLALEGTRLRCTPVGLDVLNRLLLDFLP